jgi:trans-2,3-dihydro-3-hydroxyanthranilate isomerase
MVAATISVVKIPFRLVDVFTDRPLAGNQLCVIPEPVDVSPSTMQAIAKEIGFSETTFVSEAGGSRYAMRIFTPSTELPFAGHPSLGTAFVLVSEGRVESPAVQSLSSGEFAMEVDVAARTARMEQRPPIFQDVALDRGAVARAYGLTEKDLVPDLPFQLVSTGFPTLIVPAVDEAAVARAVSDRLALLAILEPLGTDNSYIFAATGPRAKARMFTSDAAILEDPATGSAAGPLGAYMVRHGLMEPGRLTISQGVELGRPSTLLVDVTRGEEGLRVFVGGGVVKVAEGTFDLPD